MLHIPAQELRSDIPLETGLYIQPKRELQIKEIDEEKMM